MTYEIYYIIKFVNPFRGIYDTNEGKYVVFIENDKEIKIFPQFSYSNYIVEATRFTSMEQALEIYKKYILKVVSPENIFSIENILVNSEHNDKTKNIVWRDKV